MTHDTFRYLDTDVDPAAGTVTGRWALDDVEFTETLVLHDVDPDAWSRAGVADAIRLWHITAAVSYYKAAAPQTVDLGDVPVSPADLRWLRGLWTGGLAEYAHRNGLDLSTVAFVGGDHRPSAVDVPGRAPMPDRPLVPFGGGLDSVVVAERVKQVCDDVALFCLTRGSAPFDVLDAAAASTGLPVLRATQLLDTRILRSDELGYRNGHVPVTGILAAIATLAGVLHGRDAVVMSNEAAASAPTLVTGDGREVNHQWSKSWEAECLLRSCLAAAALPDCFSALRDRHGPWIARQFAALDHHHGTATSCNKAFAIRPDRRTHGWCRDCDKCLWVNIALAPYLPPAATRAIFGGAEPLDDPGRLGQLRTLLGLQDRPFECVGDAAECRALVVAAADRPDRAAQRVLRQAVDGIDQLQLAQAVTAQVAMLQPSGPTAAPAQLW